MIRNPFNLKCLKIFSLIFFLSFLTSDLYAQCAGTSGAITICMKETYNQGIGNPDGVLDLNAIITGESAGGTWSETTMAPCNFTGGGAFTPATGLVDTWKIKRGCVYEFTYTCSSDGSTSTVTLTLGGYPGFGTDGDVCEKNDKYNLFSTMGGNTSTPPRPNPDALADPPTQLAGGTFSTNAPAGTIDPLTGEFNATIPQDTDPFYPTFIITYTVPAVGSCPERSTSFNLTIQKKAEPGTVMPLFLCETDYLSFPTAFDLQTLFNPTPVRDPGGDWSDETMPPFGPAPTPYPFSSGISNSADSVINIRDIYDKYVAANGHDFSHTDKDIELSFKYTVFAANPICPKEEVTINITIERVIDLNGASMTANPIGVCLNEATTTPIVMTITENPMYPVEDGTYDITYTQTGANPGSGGGTVPVTFAGGSGDITINLTDPVAVGVTTICVTNAVENDSEVVPKCSRPVSGLCGTFEVYAAPDPSDTQVVVNDVCIGDITTVTISDINPGNGIQLVDGTYTVNYTLTCGTAATSPPFVVTGGTGTFDIPGLIIDGTCTITITLFTNVTTTCESVPTTITDTFVVNLVPDATLMTVNVDDTCLNDTLIVNLAGITSAPDGTYTVTYDLNPGVPGSPFTQTVVLTGGAGSFTPPVTLPVGTYTITITEIRNANCGTMVFATPSDTFQILPLPDISDVFITIANICEGDNAIVEVDDNPGGTDLASDTYTVNYTVNGGAPQTATMVYNSGTNPGGTFTIPSPSPSGPATVQITSVTSSAGCNSTGGPVNGTFNINPIPTITSANVSVNDICEDQASGATVTITGLADGNYTINYTLSAPNAGSSTASITISGGAGNTFPILVGSSNPGAMTITIDSITNTLTGCTATLTGVQATFNVTPKPILNQGELTVADVCIGNDGVGTITGATGLPNGNYDITYTLSAPNGPGGVATTTITSGNGTFSIPATSLTFAGSTTITITQITNTTTGCTTTGLSVTDTFEVLALPTIAGVVLTVADICQGQDATVNMNDAPGAPDLADGTYTVNYNVNAGSNQTTTVVFDKSLNPDGSFVITLPANGSTTVEITSVTNSAGCTSTDGPISVTFTVNPLPTITSSNVSVNDICEDQASGATVTITGLPDGNYIVNYTLSGANGGSSSGNMTISGGAGNTFPILVGSSNPGSTTITIDSITNTLTGCTATLNGVQATFNVNTNPTINQGELTVADICLGNNAVGTITGAMGLENGVTYDVTYTLSAPNGPGGVATTTPISGNNGTFSIPSTSLMSPGSTTITITAITNTTTGCTTTGLSVTATFNVIPSVDVTPSTATVPTPVCANSDVVVTINTPLTAATYDFDYILGGVNGDGTTVFSNTGLVINASGQGSFTIPGSQLPNAGLTTVTMQNFSSGGCPSTGSFTVSFTVIETLPPTLNPDGNIFCIADGPTIADLIANLTPSSGVTVYNAPTGGVAYTEATLLEQATTYYAEVTTNGCTSNTRLAVTVDLTNCADIVIPDGFSPNGDALNETFEIKFIDLLYPAYGLEIYNRYGAIVYKGNINTPKFDGKANQTTILGSDVLPVGVYFYILNYNDATGKKPVQGRLYLSR